MMGKKKRKVRKLMLHYFILNLPAKLTRHKKRKREEHATEDTFDT